MRGVVQLRGVVELPSPECGFLSKKSTEPIPVPHRSSIRLITSYLLTVKMKCISSHDLFGSPKTTMLPPTLVHIPILKPGTASPTSPCGIETNDTVDVTVTVPRQRDETVMIQILNQDVDTKESFIARQSHRDDDHDSGGGDSDDDFSEAQSETMHDRLCCEIDLEWKLEEYQTSKNRKATIVPFASWNQEANIARDDGHFTNPASMLQWQTQRIEVDDTGTECEDLWDDESETMHDDSSYEIDLPEELSHERIDAVPKKLEDSMSSLASINEKSLTGGFTDHPQSDAYTDDGAETIASSAWCLSPYSIQSRSNLRNRIDSSSGRSKCLLRPSTLKGDQKADLYPPFTGSPPSPRSRKGQDRWNAQSRPGDTRLPMAQRSRSLHDSRAVRC